MLRRPVPIPVPKNLASAPVRGLFTCLAVTAPAARLGSRSSGVGGLPGGGPGWAVGSLALMLRSSRMRGDSG